MSPGPAWTSRRLPSGCSARSVWRWCPGPPSGRRAPGTSASATRPPTSRSSRRWTASSASWRGTPDRSVTATRSDAVAGFSDTAENYAASMAPSLAVVAAEVVRRAALRPGERVLDLGTGTGSGAALARGEGRAVTGVDGAAGMLKIARHTVPEATFVETDFGELPFAEASFEVAMAVHSLHFAADPVAVLAAGLRGIA